VRSSRRQCVGRGLPFLGRLGWGAVARQPASHPARAWCCRHAWPPGLGSAVGRQSGVSRLGDDGNGGGRNDDDAGRVRGGDGELTSRTAASATVAPGMAWGRAAASKPVYVCVACIVRMQGRVTPTKLLQRLQLSHKQEAGNKPHCSSLSCPATHLDDAKQYTPLPTQSQSTSLSFQAAPWCRCRGHGRFQRGDSTSTSHGGHAYCYHCSCRCISFSWPPPAMPLSSFPPLPPLLRVPLLLYA